MYGILRGDIGLYFGLSVRGLLQPIEGGSLHASEAGIRQGLTGKLALSIVMGHKSEQNPYGTLTGVLPNLCPMDVNVRGDQHLARLAAILQCNQSRVEHTFQ